MREQDKIESFLSSVRHDLRSEIMVIREGTSIILDNLVGSNCDNCFAILRHALKSTDQLNKMIGESLSVSHLVKIIGPLFSAKEEELANAKREILKKGGELEKVNKKLSEKEEEIRSVKRELLKKEEELMGVRRELPAIEDGPKGTRDEMKEFEPELITYELMGMISHIIRTPLSVIKESLSLVLDEIPGKLNTKQKELLFNGKTSVNSLIHSIEELSRESWEDIIRLARQQFPTSSLSPKGKLIEKKRILIIEDQTIISNMLKMRLEANNYEVVTAADGQEGLEKARREKPDLILLDIMLPKMDGYQICRLLKADPKYRSIPIIISSGRTPQEIEKVGKEVGADAFISKPFEAEVLLAKMQELLEKKRP
jgi:CheY-like chemotaxis protein